MTDWVFLRGLTRSAAHWGNFPARFEAAFPGARVHLLDLPGNGVRHGERSPVSVPAMLADCRQQLVDRDIRTPVHLLALSLGAMVAAHWLHTAADEVRSAVLINTSMKPFSPMHHRMRPGNLLNLLRLAQGGRSVQAAERMVWKMTSRQPQMDESVVAAWMKVRQRYPVRNTNALRQLLAAARFRAGATPPRCPVLVMGSEQDRLVDARCSQALARAWACPLAQHPWAGHDLALDDPVWVIDQICAWIAATDALSPT